MNRIQELLSELEDDLNTARNSLDEIRAEIHRQNTTNTFQDDIMDIIRKHTSAGINEPVKKGRKKKITETLILPSTIADPFATDTAPTSTITAEMVRNKARSLAETYGSEGIKEMTAIVKSKNIERVVDVTEAQAPGIYTAFMSLEKIFQKGV